MAESMLLSLDELVTCPINVRLLNGEARESIDNCECREVTVALYCRKLGLVLDESLCLELIIDGDPGIIKSFLRFKVNP